MHAFERLKRGNLRSVPTRMRSRYEEVKEMGNERGNGGTLRRCKLRAGHERTIFDVGTDHQFE